MAADKRYFNGSVVSFAAATIGKLRSIKWDAKGKDIEVTGSDDTEHVSAIGLAKQTLSITVVGPSPTFGVGSTGALACTWADGQTFGTITTVGVVSISKSGSMDGEVTSDIEFVKVPPTA
jgi:hypothetical protein